jgi:hypothetical protein
VVITETPNKGDVCDFGGYAPTDSSDSRAIPKRHVPDFTFQPDHRGMTSDYFGGRFALVAKGFAFAAISSYETVAPIS